MVYGTFISTAVASSSASSASASAASSSSTSSAPTPVQVKGYTVSGELCYSWTRNGVEERSYAKEWTSIEWAGGVKGLKHNGKNLVSRLP